MPHRTHSELQSDISRAKELVMIGCEYIHYKYPGKRYKVLDVGIQEDSEAICVIYCDTNMPDIHFVRNLDSWLEQVEYGGQVVPRFVLDKC